MVGFPMLLYFEKFYLIAVMMLVKGTFLFIELFKLVQFIHPANNQIDYSI